MMTKLNGNIMELNRFDEVMIFLLFNLSRLRLQNELKLRIDHMLIEKFT